MANHPQRPQPGRGPSGGGPSGGHHSGGQHSGNANQAAFQQVLAPPTARFQYFSDKDRKTPRPEIFDKDARDAGAKLAGIPPSQLRRFYAETTALKRQLELTRDATNGSSLSDEAVRARLHLLKARAAYTWARHKNDKSHPDYEELARFFTLHAESVQGKEDFLLGFQPYFEAVIAYHAAANASKENKEGA